jgi:hypothetical protein
MADLTDEQRRALRLLARSPNGCTHGFESTIIGKFMLDGLATAEIHDTKIAGRRVKVVWLQITAAGRRALG